MDSADGIQQRVQAIAHSQVVPSAVELDRSVGAATLQPRSLEGTVAGRAMGAPRRPSPLLGNSAGSSDEPPAWWGSEPTSEHGVLVKLTHEISGLSRLLDAVDGACAATGLSARLRGSAVVGHRPGGPRR